MTDHECTRARPRSQADAVEWFSAHRRAHDELFELPGIPVAPQLRAQGVCVTFPFGELHFVKWTDIEGE